MKKLVLSLAVLFTIGMVSCGNKDKEENAAPEEVGVEEVTDEGVVTETPQGEVGEAIVEVEEAGENVGEAAAKTASDVKTKSQDKVKEAKEKAEAAVNNAADKAEAAVNNAADKAADAVAGAAQDVANKAQSAADRAKEKANRMKGNN